MGMDENFAGGAQFDNIVVEDAPLNVDLDMLLGDDMIGKEDFLKRDDEVKVEETKIEEPHFKVSTRKFSEALKISGILAQGSGRDILGKAIGMEVVDGKLNVYLTDFEMFVKREIDVICSGEMLTDFIVVNLPIIHKVLEVCTSVLTILKRDNKYYIKVRGAEMTLETINVAKEQLIDKDIAKYVPVGSLPTNEFRNALKNLFVLAASAVVPPQRRIFVGGKEISAVYLFSAAKCMCSSELPEMDLSVKVIKILYILSTGIDSMEMRVRRFKNKVMIEASGFSFSFLTSDFKPQKVIIDSMGSIVGGESVAVSYSHLAQIAKLSYGLAYSTTRMEFNYTPEGKVECVLKTKRSDEKFLVDGDQPNLRVRALEKPVGIQSSLLKNLLGVFSQSTLLNVVITDKGIGISNGNYDAVLYTETADSM